MTERANVPCNGCTLCCRHHNAVLLMPEHGDVLATYDYDMVEPFPGAGLMPILKRVDGVCIYLKDGGCSIWWRSPAVCRTFDCRGWYQSMTRAERRRLVRTGLASQEVFDRGRELLEQEAGT